MEWLDPKGELISCEEKQEILEDALTEVSELFSDLLDDALLMGCSEANFRENVKQTLSLVRPTVKEKS